MIADTTEPPAAAIINHAYVLVVDDEPAIREEIIEYLAARGFLTQSASNGDDALQQLAANPRLTVLLSDIRMPKMNGVALAEQVVALASEEHALEIVMLTGHATIRDAAAATRLGAIDFLEKPIELADLRIAVQRAHDAAMARRTRWQRLQSLQSTKTAAQAEIVSLRTIIEQLRKSDSLGRDTFMAVMNHELRTPLVPIIGLAELIEQSAERLQPAQLRIYAREIRTGGQRLERALSRVTEFTGLMSGQAQFPVAPCRPDRIVQAVADGRAADLAERNMTLSLAVNTTRALNSNATKIQRVLEELIDNASRFSGVGSTIQLAVDDERDGVAFSVTDTGTGMTNAEIELAMGSFRQIDMSLARRVEGFGIGLPMASRIAEGLGGSLSIESQPGVRTTVTLHLPAQSVLAVRP